MTSGFIKKLEGVLGRGFDAWYEDKIEPRSPEEVQAELGRLSRALGLAGRPHDLSWSEPEKTGHFDYPSVCGLVPDDWPWLLELVRRGWSAEYEWPEDPAVDPPDPAAWSPIHAWRALGQLGVPESRAAVLGAVTFMDAQAFDWQLNDAPRVLALMGPPAVPLFAALLTSDLGQVPDQVVDLRETVVEALGQIRGDGGAVEKALTQALGDCQRLPPLVNALVVLMLLRRGVLVDHAGLAEQAYFEDHVDEQVCGGWGEVCEEAGINLPTALDLASPERRAHWWPYQYDEEECRASRVAEHRHIRQIKREQNAAAKATKKSYKKRKPKKRR